MFEVRWIQDAVSELTSLWIQADSASRKEVTSATYALDLALQANPLQNGESRGENEFVRFIYPLGVIFEIDGDNRRVYILHVWRFRRRTST